MSLESDGTFTFRRPSYSCIADLHSLEVMYLLSPQTSADRKEWEDRGRLDPLYALDELAFAYNPLKSLRRMVFEKAATSTSVTSTSTAATTVSPQALLQQEKDKEATLRAEIALWTQIQAQRQLNKDLEKQIAALKKSV